MLEKTLGKEIENLMARTIFLRDNCDRVEDLGYVKSFSSEEMENLKERLVENNIQLRDVRADKKQSNKEFNEQIKQLQESNDETTKKLKERSEFVNEQCFMFIDEESGMVGYYNQEGDLVHHRPARADEFRKSVFGEARRATGTND